MAEAIETGDFPGDHHPEVAIDPGVVETGEVIKVDLVVAAEIMAEVTTKIATDIKHIDFIANKNRVYCPVLFFTYAKYLLVWVLTLPCFY